jgi:hypothetical protein
VTAGELVVIEWTIESYTRMRATVDKGEWDKAIAEDRGDEFLGELEAKEEGREYDYGVTARHAYINNEEVL